jgi:protein TonB
MLVWPCSVLGHVGALAALSSLTVAIDLGEPKPVTVTDTQHLVLAAALVVPDLPDSPPPAAIEDQPVPEPLAPDWEPLPQDCQTRIETVLEELRDPAQIADDPVTPTPTPSRPELPARLTPPHVAGDFALLRPHASEPPGGPARMADAGGFGGGGDGPGIGRGTGGSGTGSGYGEGRGFGSGTGSGSGSGNGTAGGVAGASGPSGSRRGTLPPKPKQMARGAYPDEARRNNVQGTVLLSIEVLSSGKVGQVAVARSSGSTALDRAACGTAQSWTFTPAEDDGQPIVAELRVSVVFKLTNSQ